MSASRLTLFGLFAMLCVSHAAESLFDRSNLAAWCIVPFDAKKRGPEERAAMLEKMGVRKFVYDYRAEHIPQWDEELDALKRHHIELVGWWFPTVLNDEAKKTLELFKRHAVKPQLWVSGSGGSIEVANDADQRARVAKEVERLKPICEAAKPLGCQVGLYNHGSWYGEPENALAIVEALKAQGISNVGIVYNLHHGHGHLDRLDKVLPKLLPHLLCVNLNGMDLDGEAKGRKILPLGVGTEDLRVLKSIAGSGYQGMIGILNHTSEDAEGRLLDNLDGLNWLLPQITGKPAGAKPKYRTWNEKAATSAASPHRSPADDRPSSVASLSPEFGQALKGQLALEGKDAYRTLPISIECRAKLNSARGFNILVACDPKASADHWELYSYRESGFFSLYLPGRGGDFRSNVNICDGRWHDLIASIEADMVRLYIDGKPVLEKPAQPQKGKPQPGGLAIGGLVEGTIGCDGLIDDVRISRGPMKPRKGDLPRQRMDNTLELWSFDDLSTLVVVGPEPAPFAPDRKPLREEEYPHWQHEVNRDRVFDFYGKEAIAFMGKPLPNLLPAYPGLDGGQQGHWGNQNDQVTWHDGRWAAADHGNLFSTVFKAGGLTIPKAVCVRLGDNGEMAACFDPQTFSFPVIWQGGFIKLSEARHGFMGGGQMDGKLVKKMAAETAPNTSADYHGFYRHGKRIIFAYRSGDQDVLDSTWVENGQFVRLREAAEKHPLRDLTKGGPTQWPGWLETKGKVGNGEPFATDTITIPFDNPYGTLFFISGHDFFSDGSAAIATMTGEVWLVRGIDDKLEKVRWKRFATGLHHPLGVKIVNDKIHVLGRDQITCLQDLNGDDEADFYECVSNAYESSPGGHDYITGLDMDKEGRFYFASGNQGVCRVTVPRALLPSSAAEAESRAGEPSLRDGRRQPALPSLQILATGFRNPNGLGLSPDGRFVTTSVQEGDWTPSSQICQIELGVNEGAHFGAGGPKNGAAPEPPLMFLPRAEDNSSGGQCFIPDNVWTALRGNDNLVHVSPGTGTAWLVMRQQIEGRWQGAAVRISGSFDSGAQTARFNPRDGHVYVTGMQGWGSYTPLDGCFQRVRYTGGAVAVPVGFEARDNGVMLRFDKPLTAEISGKKERHFAQYWNYHYSAAYGSPEFSVHYPDTVGHDPLEVRSAQLLDESRSLFLEIPQLNPASVIHLRVAVTAERSHDLFLTAHKLAPPFTDFSGYEKVAKIGPAKPAATSSAATSKPNPWAKGEPGREIIVEAALGLQFVQKQLTAKAGEAITLIFKNPDVVPHNWLLAKPGSLQRLGDLANLMITDPQGLAKHYVPNSNDVIAYTDMTQPKTEFTIHFKAPTEKGDYPYLCTFPGHWMVMNGVMKVE